MNEILANIVMAFVFYSQAAKRKKKRVICL